MVASEPFSPQRRLADEARARGVRILHEPHSGEYFATSASDRDLVYRLTGYSCSCRGFVRWGRCGHHALLLEKLGWAPDEPDPVSPAPAVATKLLPCPVCLGRGTEIAFAGQPREVQRPCQTCHGDRVLEVIDGETMITAPTEIRPNARLDHDGDLDHPGPVRQAA